MLRTSTLAWLASLIAMLLSSCISMNTPGDLTFASIKVGDWRDQTELPELDTVVESLADGAKRHRLLLKIEFTSATDLERFASKNSYNVLNRTFLCGRPPGSPEMSYPFVYRRGVQVDAPMPSSIKQQGDQVPTLITYYIFVDVARAKIVPSKPPQEGFDLRRSAEDVCFYLGGGNELSKFRSNTVVIPTKVIAAVLRAASEFSNESSH